VDTSTRNGLKTADVTEIPIDQIKIHRRMRRTDEERIQDLSQSILNVGLLHAISVATEALGKVTRTSYAKYGLICG
jgi:hypothetical protein